MRAVICAVIEGVAIFAEVLSWAVFADVVLSWVMPDGPMRDFTSRFCAPIVQPFRKLSDRFTRGMMPVDLAPTIAVMVLFFVSSLLASIAALL